MDGDEGWALLDRPRWLVERLEGLLAQLGIPAEPLVLQATAFVLGLALAVAFALFARRGTDTLQARVGAGVLAVAAVLLVLPVLVFWGQFAVSGPSGEVWGRIEDNPRTWTIRLVDHRGRLLGEARLDRERGHFAIYYVPAFGQMPDRIEATRPDCRPVLQTLQRRHVVYSEPVELRLPCEPITA